MECADIKAGLETAAVRLQLVQIQPSSRRDIVIWFAWTGEGKLVTLKECVEEEARRMHCSGKRPVCLTRRGRRGVGLRSGNHSWYVSAIDMAARSEGLQLVIDELARRDFGELT